MRPKAATRADHKTTYALVFPSKIKFSTQKQNFQKFKIWKISTRPTADFKKPDDLQGVGGGNYNIYFLEKFNKLYFLLFYLNFSMTILSYNMLDNKPEKQLNGKELCPKCYFKCPHLYAGCSHYSQWEICVCRQREEFEWHWGFQIFFQPAEQSFCTTTCVNSQHTAK